MHALLTSKLRTAPGVAATVALFSVFQPSHAPAQEHSSLRDTLVRLDSLLFEAIYHACDADLAERLLAEDVEFYHDRGGLLDSSRETWLADMRENGCPSAQRRLDRSSMEVHRIGDYGALQMARHEFHVLREDDTELVEVARFIHLWKRASDGRWLLARVISYDHQHVD